VADELRRNKKVIPRYYKMVTIMFTDFKGFTTIAAQMSPGEIVRELDACFVAFDQIIEQYEQSVGKKCVEKIKTIGDGYMCAGGVPLENDTNPTDVLRVALAMKEFMEKRKREKEAKNEPFFEIRIGINTGPVVAGVVGKKKFAYDIWGDAVNLASRMESGSEAGKINISGETYKYVKDKFFFTPRGKINTKSKGEVDMYFVDGRVRYAEARKT
jgi:class 3 adenylate cyclase